MNRAVGLIIIGIILLPIFIPIRITAVDNYKSMILTSGQYGKGYRYNIQGWVYIHIEGEPYERGYQYGYLASAEIMDMMQRWINLEYKKVKLLIFFPISNLCRSPEKLWNYFKDKAEDCFKKYVPEEYIKELKGLTDGLKAKGAKIFNRGIEFEDILTYQFIQDIEYSSFKNPFKRSHFLQRLFFGIKQILTIGIDDFYAGHCTAFIATGDATKNGEIVVAHSSIFNKYVAERCNILLDVEPSDGNRFLMTCPPGSIWSQEDWYQNEKGIILTETELIPQGPWKKRGIPKGVRSRKAIQYSDCIDEVIELLINGNNGLIPNEWLIGDKKTGEIASIQLALYNRPIKRTFDGYYWSCNLPHNRNVIRELWYSTILFNILSRRYPQKFFLITAEKFKELGEQNYGKIDTYIAKKIMSTHPIYENTTDCKITCSDLMDQMGLLLFMGRPDGEQWIPTDEEKNKYIGVTELPTSGWLEVYPSKTSPKIIQSVKPSNTEKKGKVLWKYETDNARNMDYFSSSVSDNLIYTAIPTGKILTFRANSGVLTRTEKIDEIIIESVVVKDTLFVGGENGLYAIDKQTGNIKWKQRIGCISCKPVIANNLVITGCNDGNIHAFDISSGKISWSQKFPDSPVISEISQDVISIGSGNSCYGLNIKNRELLWQFRTNAKITAAPKIQKNVVYVGSWDGNLYALDLRSGNLKWTFKTGWGIVTTPAISNNRVFVASNDNNFYAIDEKNGNLDWFFNCKSAIHSNPVVYGKYVFFGSDDGRLYALDKTKGNIAWSFTPGYFIKNDALNYLTTPILSDPYIEDGIVYISAKGTIYALDAQTLEKPENISKDDSYKIIKIFIITVLIFIGIILISIPIRKLRKKQ